jgi:hypothetical protein
MKRARDWRGRFCRPSNHLQHGHTANGKWSPTYSSFCSARQRCRDPKVNRWEFYGGAGVKFLWKSFPQFLAELGSKPRGRSLGRVNDSGNYGPNLGNHWQTVSQQRQARYNKHNGRYN